MFNQARYIFKQLYNFIAYTHIEQAYYLKWNFLMTSLSVGMLVGRSVIIFGDKFHFHAPIGAFVHYYGNNLIRVKS